MLDQFPFILKVAHYHISVFILYYLMNKIVITNLQEAQYDDATFVTSYENANKILNILRSDHFRQITLIQSSSIPIKDLKFLIQLSRLLKSDGQVVIQSSNNQSLNTILKSLNLFEGQARGDRISFLKTKPIIKQEKPQKLAIGFHSNEQEEEIDENQLLQGENLQIAKKQAEKCQTKPRACANCSCGRKQAQSTISKQDLIKSVNEGKPVSGCGKCLLGDSFRCGTCPYKGLPAFKLGDKLKLVEEGGVVVQQTSTFVSVNGKVKLQL